MKNFPFVCVDGKYGKSTHVIIERNSQKITHFVVRVANFLEPREYSVPIEQVIATTPKAIQLRCTKQELATMPSFIQMQFLDPVTYEYEALEDFSVEGFASRNSYLMWSNPAMNEDLNPDIIFYSPKSRANS